MYEQILKNTVWNLWLQQYICCLQQNTYIVHCQRYTLFSVFWHFFMNTSRYTSTNTSTCLLREVSYSKLPHATYLQKRSTTSVACRFIETAGYVLGLLELSQKCHPSTRGSTRSLLRTLCTAFTLAFFTGSKKAWDWMSNGSLQSHSLAAFSCPWRAVSHHLLLWGQA